MLAHKCDPISSFGGIVSCNFKINKKLAIVINKLFFEVIIAKGFDKEALSILKKKNNLRQIDCKNLKMSDQKSLITNSDFALLQSQDISNDQTYYTCCAYQ